MSDATDHTYFDCLDEALGIRRLVSGPFRQNVAGFPPKPGRDVWNTLRRLENLPVYVLIRLEVKACPFDLPDHRPGKASFK